MKIKELKNKLNKIGNLILIDENYKALVKLEKLEKEL